MHTGKLPNSEQFLTLHGIRGCGFSGAIVNKGQADIFPLYSLVFGETVNAGYGTFTVMVNLIRCAHD